MLPEYRGIWLAQSIEHATVDLGVMSSSPRLGVEITTKKKLLEYNDRRIT